MNVYVVTHVTFPFGYSQYLAERSASRCGPLHLRPRLDSLLGPVIIFCCHVSRSSLTPPCQLEDRVLWPRRYPSHALAAGRRGLWCRVLPDRHIVTSAFPSLVIRDLLLHARRDGDVCL